MLGDHVPRNERHFSSVVDWLSWDEVLQSRLLAIFIKFEEGQWFEQNHSPSYLDEDWMNRKSSNWAFSNANGVGSRFRWRLQSRFYPIDYCWPLLKFGRRGITKLKYYFLFLLVTALLHSSKTVDATCILLQVIYRFSSTVENVADSMA